MRRWLGQFLGVMLLACGVWAFLNTPDEHPWQVGLSAVLAIGVLAGATWLIAANFSGAVRRSRLPLVFGCLGLLLALLWLTGFNLWPPATWLASALTHQRTKALPPEVVYGWLAWAIFAIRWIVLPALLIPLAIRAAGAKPVPFLRLAAIYLASFCIGAVAPHFILYWVPKVTGLWPQIASAALRFGIAYAMLITAWVWLGRAVRAEGPR